VDKFDILIVGSGFAGSVVAERLAAAGKKILIIDKRPHIGGNAFDVKDANGVQIHPYGPHIFHTNRQHVFDYLSRFTEWRHYEHRVLSSINGRLYPFPINRDTLNLLYHLNLDEAGAQAFFERVREPRNSITNSEDLILSTIGRELYEAFYLNYTRKQWGLEPAELKTGVAARIPVRTNSDDRYFTDKFQGMPKSGYTAMFRNILEHRNIHVELKTDFDSVRNTVKAKHLIYTGPIDSYFRYCYGHLPYRSLHFHHVHLPEKEQFQPVGTVNYPNDHDYTRITEFKHLTGQHHPGTSIMYEYPRETGDPYYPIPRVENEILFKRYQDLAAKEPLVTFVGRLAEYRYYNMDEVVDVALKTAVQLTERVS
jgi:UDP-galactopyranose mutase